MLNLMQMKVDKTQFDELLGKLIKAKPLPKAEIPKKARRKRAAQSEKPKQDQPKSEGR